MGHLLNFFFQKGARLFEGAFNRRGEDSRFSITRTPNPRGIENRYIVMESSSWVENLKFSQFFFSNSWNELMEMKYLIKYLLFVR